MLCEESLPFLGFCFLCADAFNFESYQFEVMKRYIAQLRDINSAHPWVADLQAKEALFDELVAA